MRITMTFEAKENQGWRGWRWKVPCFFLNTILGIEIEVMRVVDREEPEKQ